MISFLAQEIAKWIAEHHGAKPESVRVPQAIADECEDEAKRYRYTRDSRYARGKMKIYGIPVLVDPTLTIGKIDP